jgi:hypothetical protein
MDMQHDGNDVDKKPAREGFRKSPHQGMGAGVSFVLEFAKSLREQRWPG